MKRLLLSVLDCRSRVTSFGADGLDCREDETKRSGSAGSCSYYLSMFLVYLVLPEGDLFGAFFGGKLHRKRQLVAGDFVVRRAVPLRREGYGPAAREGGHRVC